MQREKVEWLAIRDTAILSCLFDTGMRASELTGLTLEHVHLSRQDAYLKVFGKGNKWREVPLGVQARAHVHRYITRYRPKSTHHTVFLSRIAAPLSLNGIGQIIKRLADRAHIEGAHVHMTRHTMAVNYLASGGDVYKLSRILGHVSVKITENYLRAFQSRDARTGGTSLLDNLGK